MKKTIFLITTLLAVVSAVPALGDGGMSTNIKYTDNQNILNKKDADKYSVAYKAGIYQEDTALPYGEYVIFAEDGKIGSYTLYDKAENENIYKESFEYCTIAYIDSDSYLILDNAYAVPSKDVEKLDITKNGVFRVGIDLPEDELNFVKDSDSSFGYVENFYFKTKDLRKTELLDNDADSYNLTVMPNSYIVKINCDIYNGSKLIADYKNAPKIISTLDIGKVTPELKAVVTSDINTIQSGISTAKISSEKMKTYYLNKLFDNWQDLAKNELDIKYIEDNYKALTLASNYYEVIKKAHESGIMPNCENDVARALSDELHKLSLADSFDEIDKSINSITACLSEASINLGHNAPDFRFGY